MRIKRSFLEHMLSSSRSGLRGVVKVVDIDTSTRRGLDREVGGLDIGEFCGELPELKRVHDIYWLQWYELKSLGRNR